MIRAELLALTTTTATRAAALTGVIGLAFTQLALVTLLPALARGDIGPGGDALGDDLLLFDLSTRAAQLTAINPLGAMGSGSIGIALVAVALLGVLAATTDYRHGSIVQSTLAEPRRGRMLAAKAIAAALVGLAVGVIFALTNTVILLVSLAVIGQPLEIEAGLLLVVLARGTVVIAAIVTIGFAVGSLARNQVVGIIVMLGILVAEPVIAGVAELVDGGGASWTALLPGALIRSAVGVTPGGLDPLPALAALGAVTVAALAVASAVLSRRDL